MLVFLPVLCWFSFWFRVGFPSGFVLVFLPVSIVAISRRSGLRGPVWDLFTNTKPATKPDRPLVHSVRLRGGFGSGFVRRALSPCLPACLPDATVACRRRSRGRRERGGRHRNAAITKIEMPTERRELGKTFMQSLFGKRRGEKRAVCARSAAP